MCACGRFVEVHVHRRTFDLCGLVVVSCAPGHGGVCGIVQVPLMAYVERAVAALDDHRAVAGVVVTGLDFLSNLSEAASNQVCVTGFGGGTGASHVCDWV